VSQGSWIHDEVVRHFGSPRLTAGCAQCAAVRAEEIRIAQPLARRKTIPDEVLGQMCSAGRSIYRSYLRWLAEPDK
jgi:hypothetical protein